jgi:hypothetical protein
MTTVPADLHQGVAPHLGVEGEWRARGGALGGKAARDWRTVCALWLHERGRQHVGLHRIEVDEAHISTSALGSVWF